MELTVKKAKPSKSCMIHSFVKGDITYAYQRAKRFLSRQHLQYVAKEVYAIPDSKNCLNALEMVSDCSPDFLVNHCLRSYAFGVAMAHKIRQPFDSEVFFLGSIMHDLGLTDKYDGEDTFELEGAVAARSFCVERELAPAKSDLVHEMVALHNSVGIAHKLEPEIALLHFGAGADVAGIWIGDIHTKTLDEILDEYPRTGFKQGMKKLIAAQIDRKPQSYMSTMVELGFLDKVESAPFTS